MRSAAPVGMRLPEAPQVARWRTGNTFALMDEPDAFFGRMLAAIDAARRQVLLEMYLVSSGRIALRFVTALAAAARRGVDVRVLLDGFGSLGLKAADREELRSAGVELRYYNPIRWLSLGRHNLMRNHRKLLVIDQLAFVGGAGLTDEFGCGDATGCPWRDLMVEIEGPVVADWRAAYARTWSRAGGDVTGIELAPPAAVPHGTRGRVVLSDASERSALARGVLQRIDSVQQRAWIMSAYFVPSRRVRTALRRAARRGVDVRLLVPGPITDHPWVRHAARRYYGKLLRNGVQIYEFQPRMLHGKMIVCDDWVSVGSSNLDRWSFRWNLEANQEIDDGAFAGRCARLFTSDCAHSERLTPESWRRRARFDRLREHIAGTVGGWLDRFRRPRGP